MLQVCQLVFYIRTNLLKKCKVLQLQRMMTTPFVDLFDCLQARNAMEFFEFKIFSILSILLKLLFVYNFQNKLV